MEIETTSIER